MAKYNVSFVIRDWVSVTVDADTEEIAREKARKKVNNVYNKSNISVNDGKTNFCGITNEDVLDILND